MWGIASQAGTGIAIAGITATYYALANRNYQGEQERMAHEIDPNSHGDGPNVHKNAVKDKDEKPSTLSSSNLLLKKELQEMSILNGSVSGLNILYQQQTPLNKFPRSQFEIPSINSRVNTHPSSIFSPSDDDITSPTPADAAAEFEADKKLVAAANEHFQTSEESNEDLGEATPPPEGNESDDSRPTHHPNDGHHGQSLGERWKKIQETPRVHRTTSSPICFFKNPEFGNKYTFKKDPEEASPVPAGSISSQLQLSGLDKDEDKDGDESEKAKSDKTEEEAVVGAMESVSSSSNNDNDVSTQFIFPPGLSQPTPSDFEKDLPEKLLKAGKNNCSTSDTATVGPERKLKPKRRSTATIRQRKSLERTNSWIQLGGADEPVPEVEDVRPTRKRSGKPVILPPEVESGWAKHKREDKGDGIDEEDKTATRIKSEELLVKKLDENDDWYYENLRGNGAAEILTGGGVLEEPLLLPRSTVSAYKIKLGEKVAAYLGGGGSGEPAVFNGSNKDLSWRSLPVRVYKNAMRTMPWPLLCVCALVVVIVGLFGMFLIRLANQIIHSRGVL